MAGLEEFSQESSGHQQPTASQDISLFSDSAVPSPEPSLSPSISSFTHSSCSQSILKQIDPIVSSDPAVEQIHVNVADLSSNTNLEGPAAYSDINSSMSGSKEAPNSNVSCSFLQGAKAALNKLKQIGSSNSPNSQIPKSQNSVISKSSAACQAGRTPQHDFLSPSGRLADLDSSSSESLFKPPIPPKHRRQQHNRGGSQSPLRVCSRSPHVDCPPGTHKGMPQASPRRPSKCP